MKNPLRIPALGTVTLAALLATPAPPARAQDPARPDEALEKLLENLGEKPKADAPADPAKKPEDKPKADDKPKPDAKPKPKADDKPAGGEPAPKDDALEKMLEGLDGPKPAPDAAKPADPAKKPDDARPVDPKKAGEVGGKDQSLDKLLEGFGGGDDKPSPDDRKPPGGGGGAPDQPTPPGPGGEDRKPDPLDAASRKLDDLLEEKTGRRPKPKPGQRGGQGQGQGQGGDEDGGPLGDLIKQMRDVEGRLGQPDTGEETRKKQVEIVKNLDQLLEQVRNSSSQSQAMRMMRGGEKPGGPPQPGQGNQPGATAQGVGEQKPATPRTPPTPVELAKEIWGQLPTQFRDDQANILKENPLPSKAELIRLYYLSLGKKSASSQGN